MLHQTGLTLAQSLQNDGKIDFCCAHWRLGARNLIRCNSTVLGNLPVTLTIKWKYINLSRDNG